MNVNKTINATMGTRVVSILYLTSTPVVRKCQASRENLENPGKLAPCPGNKFKVVGRYAYLVGEKALGRRSCSR